MTRRLPLAILALLLAGCPSGGGDGDAGGLPLDGGAVDGQAGDAGRVDQGAADASARDAGGRDASPGDAGLDDARVGDAGAPDGATPDAGPVGDCPAVVADTDAEGLDELTGALAVAGHLDGARCAAERLVALQPDHPLALNNLAFVRLEADDVEGALALLRPLAREWPDSAPILQNLAMAASRAGAHAEAAAAADALVAQEPDDPCTAEVARAVVGLRAGTADEDEARRLIEDRCDLKFLWQRLVDEGHAAATPPRPAVCVPVLGAPDERSTCPNGGGCFEPVIFAVPDCLTHPDVCAAQPYWQNYSFGDQGQPVFGVVTGERVIIGTVEMVTVSCEDEEECFIVTTPQPPRGLSVSLVGPAVGQPGLTLPMRVGDGVAAGSYYVVFPLFPQRVIHPSSAAAEVGCPGMRGPFYHFSSEGELEAMAQETADRLAAMDGFRVTASASVGGFHPSYGWRSPFWQEQPCPMPPYLQCQDATVAGPAAPEALPPLPAGCADGFLRGLEDLQRGGGPDTVLLEVSTSTLQCDLPGPGELEGVPFDPVRAILTAALPNGSSAAVLFSVPTGALEVTIDGTGKLNVNVRGGLISFDGGVGLLDGAFDVRLGVGPAVNVARGMAAFDLTVGFGVKGNLQDRSVHQLYGNIAGSACFGRRQKLSVDYAIAQVDLAPATDRLTRGFNRAPGQQVALSSKR